LPDKQALSGVGEWLEKARGRNGSCGGGGGRKTQRRAQAAPKQPARAAGDAALSRACASSQQQVWQTAQRPQPLLMCRGWSCWPACRRLLTPPDMCSDWLPAGSCVVVMRFARCTLAMHRLDHLEQFTHNCCRSIDLG